MEIRLIAISQNTISTIYLKAMFIVLYIWLFPILIKSLEKKS